MFSISVPTCDPQKYSGIQSSFRPAPHGSDYMGMVDYSFDYTSIQRDGDRFVAVLADGRFAYGKDAYSWQDRSFGVVAKKEDIPPNWKRFYK